MSYTQYTQASFTVALAQALSDSNHVYWSQDELNRALNEALLHWGALTSYWTTRAVFPTAAATPFYDLSDQLAALRTRKYTLGDLCKEVQYHLLEPANGVAGGGTGATAQFTLGQTTSALTRQRNQFMIDARLPLTTTTINAPAPPVNLVPLDETVALITRAAWIDATTGRVSSLRRTDSYAAQSANPIWNLDPGRPYAYSQTEAMPGQMILVPPPLASGTIHLTYAKSVTLPVLDAIPLQLPDEFAWVTKWGALHEILATNSEGYDPIRSKYALERYSQGIEMATLHRSILRVKCNNVPMPLTTLASLDSGQPSWQTGTGKPTTAACAYDLLAFSRVPDGVYSITCDVVQAAPLPTAAGDFIQVGPEEINYLMNYCRHILQFKIGGVEFAQSMPLYDSFIKGAAQRNKLIAAKARYLTPLFSVAKQQEEASNAA